MIRDPSKIIVLPKMSKKEKDAFMCPCLVCMQKIEEEHEIAGQIDEVKKIVEELLESTSLSTNDFQIDISYPSINTQENIRIYLKKSNATHVKMNQNFRATRNFLKKILNLTFMFNKKYRHPLICKLQDTTFTALKQLDSVTQFNLTNVSDSQIWQCQQLLQDLSVALNSLREVHNENFLLQEITDELTSQGSKAKKLIADICKKFFINALGNPDFVPYTSIDEFQQIV